MKGDELTWGQALKKTNARLMAIAAVLLLVAAYIVGDPLGFYWVGVVAIGYLVGLVGTKKRWRGFI